MQVDQELFKIKEYLQRLRIQFYVIYRDTGDQLEVHETRSFGSAMYRDVTKLGAEYLLVVKECYKNKEERMFQRDIHDKAAQRYSLQKSTPL